MSCLPTLVDTMVATHACHDVMHSMGPRNMPHPFSCSVTPSPYPPQGPPYLHLVCVLQGPCGMVIFWAARYNTWLLIKLTPKGVVFSFLF